MKIYANQGGEWVTAFKKEEEWAISYVLNNWRPSLRQMVNAIVKNDGEAEDIVTEAVIRIWQKRDRYNEEKEAKASFFIIGRNLAFDYQRKRKRYLEHARYVLETSDVTVRDVEKATAEQDLLGHVYMALNKLSTFEKKVIEYLYKDGLSYSEIERLENVKNSSLRSHHHRATLKLQYILLGHN